MQQNYVNGGCHCHCEYPSGTDCKCERFTMREGVGGPKVSGTPCDPSEYLDAMDLDAMGQVRAPRVDAFSTFDIRADAELSMRSEDGDRAVRRLMGLAHAGRMTLDAREPDPKKLQSLHDQIQDFVRELDEGDVNLHTYVRGFLEVLRGHLPAATDATFKSSQEETMTTKTNVDAALGTIRIDADHPVVLARIERDQKARDAWKGSVRTDFLMETEPDLERAVADLIEQAASDDELRALAEKLRRLHTKAERQEEAEEVRYAKADLRAALKSANAGQIERAIAALDKHLGQTSATVGVARTDATGDENLDAMVAARIARDEVARDAWKRSAPPAATRTDSSQSSGDAAIDAVVEARMGRDARARDAWKGGR